MVKKVNKETKGVGKISQEDLSKVPTMMIATERDIALDFSTKVYKKFDQMIKAAVLFGSSAKQESKNESDIDIIIILDDVSIMWNEELIATYREELGKIIQTNPYRKSLHINTIKLSTWWQDLMKGDPVVINILRYGDALIDYGGFFVPQKALLQQGKIRSTPEAVYSLLERTPLHLSRARSSLLSVVDAYYWACVDSAHAAIISAGILPPSPEQIESILQEEFVKKDLLKSRYADFYSEIYSLAKEVIHGKRTEVSGETIDNLKNKTDDFVREMSLLVGNLVKK